jgi:threonine-phosphate decarboxylase
MLERFGHGGDLWTAQESFGLPKEQFLDFSSNMNPLGPHPIVEELMVNHWKDIVKYPDPAVRELKTALSRKYDISPESILVGNGAAELIDLIVRVLQPDITGLATPSFSEYEEAIQKSGGSVHDLELHAKTSFVLQKTALMEASMKSDLLFLGHPNNPTGKLIPQMLLDQLADSGKPLILDEAFIDFTADEKERSMLRRAAIQPDLYVIRSMTKFYSIPGIRLGFIVAHPNRIRELAKLQVQWSVNYLAQLIGAAVLDDHAFERATHEWLRTEKPWLTDQLEQLGLEVVRSDVNFLLFAFSEESGIDVKQAQKHMGAQGILIRDASLFRGLNQRYCRVAVRLRAENERLVKGLQQMIRELSADKGGMVK